MSQVATVPFDAEGLLEQLHSSGPSLDEAVAHLHRLMLKAARHQLAQMSAVGRRLGSARVDEIVNQAADEATFAALTKLESFEGRSKFTTWAFKFGVLHALSAANRAVWRDREVPLDSVLEQKMKQSSPEVWAEASELSSLLNSAIQDSLTPRQREVVIALIFNDVPIDVLAERLGTTRNALYKTLYDARNRLRSRLIGEGYLIKSIAREVRA